MMKLAIGVNRRSCVFGALLGAVLIILDTVSPAWSQGSTGGFRQTFPRIGSPQVATIPWGDPALRDRVARQHITVLGMWRGYQTVDLLTGANMGVSEVVADIRARAAAHGNGNIKIYKYSSINETSSDPQNMAARDQYDKLFAESGPGGDWWARTSAGANTGTWPGQDLTNITRFVSRDSNGLTYPEWKMTRDYNEFFSDGSFDGVFIDNVFFRPRDMADWNGDGVNDSPDDLQVRSWLRQGYVDAVRRIGALAPNMLVMGNVDGNIMTGEGMLTEPDFSGLMGAFYEHAMGMDHSLETWGGWQAMMSQYRTLLANARDGIVILGVEGEPGDYATMRYGLTSTLMDNGYYSYSTSLYQEITWYDEFNVNLGLAFDPPPQSPWQQGAYMRRFENGMAIVNPRGNGRQTLSIPPGYRRIAGAQDPSVNNGQLASSVTLNEQDGIILIADSPLLTSVPNPPFLSIQ